MLKQSLKAWLLSPVFLAASLVMSTAARAEVSSSGELFAQVPVNPHSGQIGPQSGSSVVQVSDLNSGESSENSVNPATNDQLNEYFREDRRSRSRKKQ
ncbi:MAG: hypothetical protein AAFO04_28055, partial [Cyanobacteria bacterium J06592_8]